MASPTTGQVYIDQLLTNFAVGHEIPPGLDVARSFFTLTPVRKKTSQYHVFSSADFHRDEMAVRGPGEAAAEGGFSVSQDSYTVIRRAIKHKMPAETWESFDTPQQRDRSRAAWLMNKLLVSENRLFVTNFLTAGVGWTNEVVPGTKWDAGGSTPRLDIDTGIQAVETAINRTPNRILIPMPVWRVLNRHADYTAVLGTTQTQVLTTARFEEIHGLPAGSVRLAQMSYNTAGKGLANSMADIYDEAVLIAYQNPSTNAQDPTAGRIFSWAQIDGMRGRMLAGAGLMQGIKTWYDQVLDSYYAEINSALDFKLTSADSGYLLTDVLT